MSKADHSHNEDFSWLGIKSLVVTEEKLYLEAFMDVMKCSLLDTVDLSMTPSNGCDIDVDKSLLMLSLTKSPY